MWCSLYQYVSQLHAEQKRIDHTIQRLEAQLANTPHPHSNQGRKPNTMSEEEKMLVSQRIKSYWEAWRSKRRETLQQP